MGKFIMYSYLFMVFSVIMALVGDIITTSICIVWSLLMGLSARHFGEFEEEKERNIPRRKRKPVM